MNKYKIIVNPISGRGFALKMIPVIEEKFKELGLDFDLVQTERPWHAAELAKKAALDGYDVVVSGISRALQNVLSFCTTSAKYCIQNQCPLSGADGHFLRSR